MDTTEFATRNPWFYTISIVNYKSEKYMTFRKFYEDFNYSSFLSLERIR